MRETERVGNTLGDKGKTQREIMWKTSEQQVGDKVGDKAVDKLRDKVGDNWETNWETSTRISHPCLLETETQQLSAAGKK